MTALGLGCLIWPKLRQTKKSRQKEKERDRNLLLFFILSLILQTVLHIFNKFAYFYNKNISKSATVPTLSSVPIYISSFYINQVISMEMTINRRLAPSQLQPERAFLSPHLLKKKPSWASIFHLSISLSQLLISPARSAVDGWNSRRNPAAARRYIYISDQLLGSCRAPKILNGGGRELRRKEGNIRNMCAQFVVAFAVVVVVGSTWIRLVK